MRFTQHPSNNRVLGAPKDWDQSRVACRALPITDEVIDSQPAMRSYWKPSADELKLLNEGASIVLHVVGTFHPPMRIDVEK